MTQNDLVLEYLKRNGSIDPWTAMRDLHILRLGARIYDLRAAGFDIQTVIKTTRDGYGHAVKWAEYRLKEPPVSAKTDDSKGVAVATPLPSNNNTFFEGGQI